MRPVVELQRFGTDAYGYQVRAFARDTKAASDSGVFPSLEHCLFDAGASLDNYFTSVEINLEGLRIGPCRTESLRRHPSNVAQRIRQHLRPA
ncbi:MAG: hypothetical protein ABWZ88_12045 [Variovorax sp.]